MALRVENLARRYGARAVVEGVSLHLQRGEVVGLLGPNGAGKTTIFSMIAGLIRPHQGRIFLDDHEITRLPLYRRARLGLGYLPQESSIFRKLTVADNLRAVLEFQGLSRTQQEERVQSLLESFHLTALAGQRADTLSGGERRRVEIARALAADPSFLLLDEPFAGIDPISVLELQHLIRDLRHRKIGILITDHNVQETLAVCDRAYILYQGKILASGTPEEVASCPSVRAIYLGERFRLQV